MANSSLVKDAIPEILLFNEVQKLLRFNSRSSFNELIKFDDTFPRPITLGIRRKAFIASEIRDYIERQKTNRGGDHVE